MTPPDRAPEPLSASREMTAEELVAAAEKMDVVDHAITIPAMWPRLILERALDAARDSRPIGEGLATALGEALALHLADHDDPSVDEAEFEAIPAWVHLCSERCASEMAGYLADALRATPAAVRPVERELDVELLTRALNAWWAPISEHVPGAGTYTVTLDPSHTAAVLAAEYKRLGA